MVNKLEGDVFNYTEVRSNFKAVMDKVWDDACPVIITRKGGRPVVMMSKEEYDSIKETEYLLASPANAKALREALGEYERGEVGMTFTEEEWKDYVADKGLPHAN